MIDNMLVTISSSTTTVLDSFLSNILNVFYKSLGLFNIGYLSNSLIVLFVICLLYVEQKDDK